MQEKEFSLLLPKLRPWSEYLYFHLMGEPLCHPNLEHYLELAGNAGFKIILTTNGTLLKKQKNILLNASGLHKINISLHAYEANDLSVPFQQYLTDCFSFGRDVCGKKLVVYRLWNQGGAEERNGEILNSMKVFFHEPWVTEHRGIRIADRTYLQYGDKFDWPDLNADIAGEHVFCYGLRDQIGVLCDGTVVPCCLDHEGDLALGNLFQQELSEILCGGRAKAIYDGFSQRVPAEELCRRCGYAKRFR